MFTFLQKKIISISKHVNHSDNEISTENRFSCEIFKIQECRTIFNRFRNAKKTTLYHALRNQRLQFKN